MQNTLTHADARALVAPFYDALQRPATKDVRALVERVASPDWRSHASNTQSKGREEFIQQIATARVIPEVMVRIADWQIRLDNLFLDLREPYAGLHVIPPMTLSRRRPTGCFLRHA
jgi:hypothetical protein